MESTVVESEQQDARNGQRDGASPAVVTATDVTRRYGEGDTAVDALRGVSLDVAQGKLTAVMGPSARKSTRCTSWPGSTCRRRARSRLRGATSRSSTTRS